jgi:sterol desaturase/sphingolipid hydroxylase (fatty acid hydroxylase superfamily)
MTEFLLANEPTIRLGVFVGVLLVMALWEAIAPRRRDITRIVRWTSNLGIVVVNTVVLRLVFPTAAVGFAAVAETQGWGLFNVIAAPTWVAFLVAVVVLDVAIYIQHVMFHAVPVLWRLHRMHHADVGFDVTTGLRFHPVEIVLSMVFKIAVLAALGAPVAAVLVFEIVLNATAMFNHGNVRLPRGLDAVLRLVVVTPDMHRVHHSIVPAETNSNFGFNMPWWDRLFGTFQAQPAAGHDEMTIGIEQFRGAREQWLDKMLVQPVMGPASGYPINRTDEHSRPED